MATGAVSSTNPRSMSISAARLVTVLVDDQTLTMVFSVQALVRAPSVSRPDVDDGFALDVDGNACAHLFTGDDVVRERRADPIEALVATPVNYVVQLDCSIRYGRIRLRRCGTERRYHGEPEVSRRAPS